jgi:UDP-2-acetamido-2,6-beta-L-arabino-hexul-4-ose reductase
MAPVNVLVTGARGFVGRNLVQSLRQRKDVELSAYDVEFAEQELWDALGRADLIFHLAGVNRPPSPEEFEAGNAGFTGEICNRLLAAGRAPKIVFASSTQAELDNPYGRSKLHAEETLRRFSAAAGARVTIFRWTNLFGKWCRPNYNSVTATFCHNTARGLPIQISDPSREVELAYIDDVVAGLLAELVEQVANLPEQRQVGNLPGGSERVTLARVEPTYRATVGGLAATIQSFRDSRTNLQLPELGDRFTCCLYATYLSYLPEDEFAYPLEIKSDNRGELAEFLKLPHGGQIFVSRTKPGITRGNHYHHTKVEKFLVLEGDAVIRFRHVESDEILAYAVSGKDFRVVDIPPGYTHSIENVGARDMVVLFWASEVFDPSNPDTYAAKVLDE